MLLLPTVTLPKLTVVGLIVSSMVAPVPERGIVTGALEASLTMETPPVEDAAVAGVNATSKMAALPPVSVTGREGPDTLKPFPVAET